MKKKELLKKKMQFGQNSLNINTFQIRFPPDATPEAKILIICCALLMSNFENEFSPKKN